MKLSSFVVIAAGVGISFPLAAQECTPVVSVGGTTVGVYTNSLVVPQEDLARIYGIGYVRDIPSSMEVRREIGVSAGYGRIEGEGGVAELKGDFSVSRALPSVLTGLSGCASVGMGAYVYDRANASEQAVVTLPLVAGLAYTRPVGPVSISPFVKVGVEVERTGYDILSDDDLTEEHTESTTFTEVGGAVRFRNYAVRAGYRAADERLEGRDEEDRWTLSMGVSF